MVSCLLCDLDGTILDVDIVANCVLFFQNWDVADLRILRCELAFIRLNLSLFTLNIYLIERWHHNFDVTFPPPSHLLIWNVKLQSLGHLDCTEVWLSEAGSGTREGQVLSGWVVVLGTKGLSDRITCSAGRPTRHYDCLTVSLDNWLSDATVIESLLLTFQKVWFAHWELGTGSLTASQVAFLEHLYSVQFSSHLFWRRLQIIVIGVKTDRSWSFQGVAELHCGRWHNFHASHRCIVHHFGLRGECAGHEVHVSCLDRQIKLAVDPMGRAIALVALRHLIMVISLLHF